MSTTATISAYDQLLEASRETGVVSSIAQLLGWDQETKMPSGGAEYRATQLSLLARMHHERLTSPRVAELLLACEESMDVSADTLEAANVRELRRDYDRGVKVPVHLSWLK